MKKKLFISIVALTATFIISFSVYASNNFQNAIALDYSEESASGRAICYTEYYACEAMRCLKCVSCDYVAGIGVIKGGYCKIVGATDDIL